MQSVPVPNSTKSAQRSKQTNEDSSISRPTIPDSWKFKWNKKCSTINNLIYFKSHLMKNLIPDSDVFKILLASIPDQCYVHIQRLSNKREEFIIKVEDINKSSPSPQYDSIIEKIYSTLEPSTNIEMFEKIAIGVGENAYRFNLRFKCLGRSLNLSDAYMISKLDDILPEGDVLDHLRELIISPIVSLDVILSEIEAYLARVGEECYIPNEKKKRRQRQKIKRVRMNTQVIPQNILPMYQQQPMHNYVPIIVYQQPPMIPQLAPPHYLFNNGCNPNFQINEM
ncbi:hypothetical protein AKO1_007843 [Acrasis kona]|uniref:Uncharacterized protein n=1 Tax=Acrasis kona TaxID=1008807 RepID=A0AAW2YS52_9EUKA